MSAQSQHAKRVCIMGTAPSWKMTPFADMGMDVWSLNDAYCLKPARVSRWYELHPLDKMVFRPKAKKIIQANEIPKGHYIRPEGHVEWLKEQARTIPVFLQQEPPNDWPANAHRFPIEQVEAAFGKDYWASGPAYMLAHAYLEGYAEILITGIHLATEAEYREQRPQWEHLIGRMLGPKVTLTEANGFRVYDGAIRIVLPADCPILKHGWRYAYESKPEPVASPYRDELKRTVKTKNALVSKLVAWPVNAPKDAALEQLRRLEVIEDDCRHMLLKGSLGELPPIVASLGG